MLVEEANLARVKPIEPADGRDLLVPNSQGRIPWGPSAIYGN